MGHPAQDDTEEQNQKQKQKLKPHVCQLRQIWGTQLRVTPTIESKTRAKTKAPHLPTAADMGHPAQDDTEDKIKNKIKDKAPHLPTAADMGHPAQGDTDDRIKNKSKDKGPTSAKGCGRAGQPAALRR